MRLSSRELIAAAAATAVAAAAAAVVGDGDEPPRVDRSLVLLEHIMSFSPGLCLPILILSDSRRWVGPSAREDNPRRRATHSRKVGEKKLPVRLAQFGKSEVRHSRFEKREKLHAHQVRLGQLLLLAADPRLPLHHVLPELNEPSRELLYNGSGIVVV